MDVAQLAEHWLSVHKDLGSTPSAAEATYHRVCVESQHSGSRGESIASLLSSSASQWV